MVGAPEDTSVHLVTWASKGTASQMGRSHHTCEADAWMVPPRVGRLRWAQRTADTTVLGHVLRDVAHRPPGRSHSPQDYSQQR